MATHTIIIQDKTNKTKYLLGLIKEMAKSDKYIAVDSTLNGIENMPNATTRKAIDEGRSGKVTRINDIDNFFSSI